MIYLVKVGDYYKIGYSNSLKRRLIDLQVSNAQEVELVDSWEGNQADERAIHKHLAGKNVRGEWFDLDADNLKWLVAIKPMKSKKYEHPETPKILRGRVWIKEGGCCWCARKFYYDGDGDFVKCECGHVANINQYKPSRRSYYQQIIQWYHSTPNPDYAD